MNTSSAQVRLWVALPITTMFMLTGTTLPVVAAEGRVLEEIVVSAQKRDESLQDVPISVSAVSGEKLTSAGITNLENLTAYVPNFSMNQTGIASVISIRGVSSGINEGLEQSAGMYSDGIYYGRAPLSRVPMMDMARVEVLKGPQSILFGKNSIAGAVNMITAKPTEEFEGSVTALYEPDHGEQDYRIVLSGPLTDTLRGRIAILSREMDGYMKNDFNGKDEKDEEETVFRGSLTWDINDLLTLNFKAENAQFDVRGRNIEVANSISLPTAPPGFDHLTRLNGIQAAFNNAFPVGTNRPQVGTQLDYHRDAEQDRSDNEVQNYTLDLAYQLGEHTLNFTSAWVEYDTDELCDCDFSAAKILLVPREELFEQFSQEIRLTSPLGDTFEYIAGVFYQTYDLDYSDGILVPDDGIVPILVERPPPFFNLPSHGAALRGSTAQREYTQDSSLWAVFSQVSWNINEAWKFTLGGRFSKEHKKGSREQFHIDNTGNNVGSTNTLLNGAYSLFGIEPFDKLKGDRTETAFTPLVNLQWNATDTMMLYATWTKGHKSGGFDARSNAHPDPTYAAAGALRPNLTGAFEFEEEEAKSIEVGAKMSLLDGAAEVNMALFRTDYTDLQTSQFDGVLGFNVTNAGEARIQGVEADGRWLLTDRLTLSGSMAYLDFNFEDFPNSQCYFGEHLLEPQRVVGGGLCDASGSRREYTPEWRGSVAVDYVQPLTSGLNLKATVDANYTDDYLWNATLDPRNEQEAHTIINARLALADVADKWELALIGRNLTDKMVVNYGGNTPLASTLTGGRGNSYYHFVGREKTVALQLTYRF